MVHENDMAGDGCEFGLFFSTTPVDLIQDGLYKALALALYPQPFARVSSCLVARALGAVDMTSTASMTLKLKQIMSSANTRRGEDAASEMTTAAVIDAAPLSSTLSASLEQNPLQQA